MNAFSICAARIDFALAQALAQRFDRDVNVDYLVGAGQERIRHRLAHLDPGNPLDHRRDALQVLHVECGYYVDSRGEQLFDVLVALGMAAAGRVGVCQFVDNYVFRLARQNPVDVHLLKRRAAVVDLAQRHLLEVPDQRRSLLALMGLDQSQHHVVALRA